MRASTSPSGRVYVSSSTNTRATVSRPRVRRACPRVRPETWRPDEDPRGTDVADGGYPEEQEPGADPSGATRNRAERDGDAPGTSSPEESGPGTATGNPDAAGAEAQGRDDLGMGAGSD